jgi:heme a synthase
MEKKFRRVALLTIFSVLFLIWVGGWVRSTGSGMGCPDWPKCFGVWIPPTAESQLPPDYLEHFVALRKKKNERLTKMLNAFGFTDLAIKIQNDPNINEHEPFNVYKTWIEYINRLVGVLVGFFIILTVWFAFPLRHSRPMVFWLSFIGLIGVLFEGWLGSIVVSTNLLPSLITVHMFVAMMILVVLIMAYMRSKVNFYNQEIPRTLGWIGVGVSIIALMQVMFGTQVRESVDVVAKNLGAAERMEWINNLGTMYQIHIRFYWIFLIGLAFWLWKLKAYILKESVLKWSTLLLGAMVGIEILIGIAMHYFAIPPILQPIHLLLGTGIFTLCYFMTASILNSKIRAN